MTNHCSQSKVLMYSRSVSSFQYLSRSNDNALCVCICRGLWVNIHIWWEYPAQTLTPFDSFFPVTPGSGQSTIFFDSHDVSKFNSTSFLNEVCYQALPIFIILEISPEKNVIQIFTCLGSWSRSAIHVNWEMILPLEWTVLHSLVLKD